MQSYPICVDLDGTLSKTDSLFESFFLIVRNQPQRLGEVFASLLRGKACLKAQMAYALLPTIDTLPLNEPLLAWLRHEHQAGRKLILVTAANQAIANAVAARVGCFSQVIASDATHNLKGKHKAQRLVETFGQGGFDYVGDSPSDVAVWKYARKAIVVGSPSVLASAEKVAEVEKYFPRPKPIQAAVIKALRLHQWVKNSLVFLPMIAAHEFTDATIWLRVGAAFLAFSLTASGCYLVNDLLDLPSDRHHPEKRHRPFASGDLPLAWGFFITPNLLLIAIALSITLLPWQFGAILATYFVITTSYSFRLKRIPVIDILTLAALYTIRVMGGGAAAEILPSFWLLALSMFIFLSLALVKRYSELRAVWQRGDLAATGRGWIVDDLPLIGSLGVSSGMASVLVLALYINSEQAQKLYALPEVLWFVCPLLLYWASRIWFKAYRGLVNEDPVLYVLKDRTSLIASVLAGCMFMIATWGIGS